MKDLAKSGYVADPGDFKVFAGPGSAEVQELDFKLIE